MAAVTILVVDDQPTYRQAVRSLLDGEPDMLVVAEAADGESALSLAAELLPGVVLMDIKLAGMNGIEATRRIVAAHPGCLVLALSLHTAPRLVEQALSAGAAGYVAKDTANRHLTDAIRAVTTGATFLSPSLRSP